MKYAKFLQERLQDFPDKIRKKCLPYKLWKKEISRNPISIKTSQSWKKELYNQCKRINRFIFPYPNILCFNDTNVATKTRSELCILNSYTLYKICKKLEKKLDVPALEYLETLKTEFPFIQSAEKTKLEIKANEGATYNPTQCNQCNSPKDLYIIMRCGHYMCDTCATSKWDLKSFTHSELEAKSYHVRCPECSAAVPCNLLLGAQLYKPILSDKNINARV